ncbi:MAG: ferrous iron transport protein B, partial [Deltaproteobacteria bacterium]|nr:ferrous iron transport protein B [Deltaproteobacteria bacterium]
MAGTSHKTILLVGNPNVGKSVLFNYLTGKYAQISNYPGTTVSISKGEASIGGEKVTVIDTPGVNSLFPMSEDEVVTRDILLQTEGGIVIQVADAKNLQRALALTLQLSEMNVPMILVVNMCDEADRANIEIDFVKLEKELGIPVLPTVAVRQKGVAAIREKLSQAKLLARKPAYCAAFENSLRDIGEALPSTQYRRAMATMLLAGDKRIAEKFFPGIAKEKREQIETICRRLSGQFAQPINFLMSQERQAQAKQILKKVVTQGFQRKAFSEWLGRLTIHPFWGIVTLMGVLWGVYKFVGEFGAGTLVDWIENGIFGKYVSPAAIALFDKLIPRDANLVFRLIHDCFVGEYGLITMGISYGFAIVLPIVATFFIAFSIMEDSGYLPRLAIMVNRIFKLIGLNGKAILPMVLGLGCDTMATLTTRILETRKQRLIVTLLLALSVPCSAQLGILLGMFGQMPAWTFIVWLSIILGSLFTVGFASNLLIKGDACAFVMEIPPLR